MVANILFIRMPELARADCPDLTPSTASAPTSQIDMVAMRLNFAMKHKTAAQEADTHACVAILKVMPQH